jgi:hypothetical protein
MIMIAVVSKGGRKAHRELAEKVCYFMIKKLMPRHRKIVVGIEFQANLEKNDGMMAYAMDLEDRVFEIGIDRDLMKNHGLREFITAVCHEMVHVKQYVKGELKYTGGKELWKGRDCTDMEYMEQPWEKEAYRLQDKLALEVWNEVM